MSLMRWFRSPGIWEHLRKRGSVIEEFNAMMDEDRQNSRLDKSRPP